MTGVVTGTPLAAPRAAPEAIREQRRRAVEKCSTLTARSGSNFYLAFLPLPRRQREGIFCVYAFCRRVDDIVDEPRPGTDPRRELDRWRRRVSDLVAGRLDDEDPLALGLAVTHERFGLREDDLLAVIDGMEMDLDRARYRTFDELALYCRRVAGHVGCLCLPVFGARSQRAREYALELGLAFQLTNILRDVARDARAGRIYIPLEELERHGVDERDLLEERRTRGVRELIRSQGERAFGHFRAAELALPSSERPRLYSATIMAAIYRRVLERLRDSGWDPWAQRARVPRRVKLLLAGGVLVRERALRLT